MSTTRQLTEHAVAPDQNGNWQVYLTDNPAAQWSHACGGGAHLTGAGRFGKCEQSGLEFWLGGFPLDVAHASECGVVRQTEGVDDPR